MFKQMTTLFRGALSQSSEDFSDKHALLLLKQQLRDCAHVVSESRQAVAIAIAQNEQEANQHKQVKRKITELEVRAVAAIEKNEMELATEAAETISILEAERDISAKAQDQFNSEITRLKNIVHTAEKKLKELQRGQRLAAATDKTQRIRAAHPASTLANFKDAEETLLRLQQRQQQIDTTAKVVSEMEGEGATAHLIDKLSEAGCGKPPTSSTQDVLERLKN
tara:strand:+ start:4198 stop:4866 length:669 start_codon:yes stop_codon:yes gene_type:complete